MKVKGSELTIKWLRSDAFVESFEEIFEVNYREIKF